MILERKESVEDAIDSIREYIYMYVYTQIRSFQESGNVWTSSSRAGIELAEIERQASNVELCFRVLANTEYT